MSPKFVISLHDARKKKELPLQKNSHKIGHLLYFKVFIKQFFLSLRSRFVTLYLTSVDCPNMVNTQVIAILWGSHNKAHESELSSCEKMHIVSMEMGSVGSCRFSHVFRTICWVVSQNKIDSHFTTALSVVENNIE